MKKDNRKQKQHEEEYQKPRFERVSFWALPQTKNIQSKLEIEHLFPYQSKVSMSYFAERFDNAYFKTFFVTSSLFVLCESFL